MLIYFSIDLNKYDSDLLITEKTDVSISAHGFFKGREIISWKRGRLREQLRGDPVLNRGGDTPPLSHL